MNDKINKEQLLGSIIDAIENVKGQDITIIDLRNIESAITDYFIICNGNSNTQVTAIANSVEKNVRNNLKTRPWHVEGLQNALWVLVDYVDIVVHIFQKDTREYYDLESLWGDAKITTIENKN